MKKVLAAVLAGAMVAASMTGCGSTAASSTAQSAAQSTAASTASAQDEALTATISVWGPAEDQAADKGKWLPTMCEQFKKLHPK
ncbi:MAG: hypothetical protein SOH45_06790 [Oscillospiraceae bacterium]|jgi:arabinogalactan oligomer/maltooligosaccharide transport system substrate-binding protein